MKKSIVSFVYPLNKEKRPSDYTVAVLVVDNRIFTGSACCGPLDRYNKKVGRQIAYDRAQDAYERWFASCKRKTTKSKPKAKTKKAKGKKRAKK